ncbi:MAG: hypothetical protein A7316_10310 [Candidatus Altiarchaeales archaeon WOR_SM1_86-2]|nr:MAG: hypothetical protein A7316_10310 [Candidatus Altiarchaeales archaeon WOR_SM1_86-2]
MRVKINIRKSAAENANDYYERAKKAKHKVAGAEKALKKTRREIEKLKEKRDGFMEEYAEKTYKKNVKRKEMWHEKFRWFFSSDNFLVVGGKDATSNEVLIKKHTNPEDLVFHADVHGAPFFVIKNPDKKEIPEKTREESAQAAASYSKAWKSGVGSVNVYCITHEQVSKTAPSGEYLGKGAFMISGKRQWFRGVELKIGIGFKIENDEAEVIGGALDAVKKHSNYWIAIGVGGEKSAGLARKIKEKIIKDAKKDDEEKIKKAGTDEIQKWIPAGKGQVLRV